MIRALERYRVIFLQALVNPRLPDCSGSYLSNDGGVEKINDVLVLCGGEGQRGSVIFMLFPLNKRRP
jgi:hypothetical protein